MLRKSEARFVESRKVKSEPMTFAEKQRSYRIRKKALKTLQDMILLAQNLPEKQVSQIFNADTLTPFFKVILHRSDVNKQRIAKIILELIADVLADKEFVMRFVHREARKMLSRTDDPIKLVEALFFTSMNSE
jgi:hypothetical protein